MIYIRIQYSTTYKLQLYITNTYTMSMYTIFVYMYV